MFSGKLFICHVLFHHQSNININNWYYSLRDHYSLCLPFPPSQSVELVFCKWETYQEITYNLHRDIKIFPFILWNHVTFLEYLEFYLYASTTLIRKSYNNFGKKTPRYIQVQHLMSLVHHLLVLCSSNMFIKSENNTDYILVLIQFTVNNLIALIIPVLNIIIYKDVYYSKYSSAVLFHFLCFKITTLFVQFKLIMNDLNKILVIRYL